MKGNYKKNTKSKIQNKNQRKYNRIKRIINNRFKIVQYPNMTKPSSFGPGTYTFAASKLVSGSFENQVHINAYTHILANSPEFDRVHTDFKYIKITGLSITFYSRNLPASTNMTPCFLAVNFDGDPVENLRLQDNVKRVPAYLPYDKIFKFYIPNINCQYGGSLNNWRSITDLSGYDDIYIQIHAPDNTSSWYLKIDLIIVLKGPTNAVAKSELKTDEITSSNQGSIKINNEN
jgi:hypothetical protein